MSKVKVLIVDDSALIRLLLTEIFSQDSEIEVVGAAVDPYDAREKIKKTNPDVITLDIEMPRMDGITFLKNLMRLRPVPVVMISTLTSNGADVTLEALEIGAFDYITKPSADVKNNLNRYAEEIIQKTKAAARSRLDSVLTIERPSRLPSGKVSNHFDLIAIGASTGGTEAIKHVLGYFPANLPPILLAQHIPDVFSTSYAKRLDKLFDIKVHEVREPMRLEYGHAYLAPGDDHLFVTRQGGALYCEIEKTDLVNRHRPSVDVMFNSVAKTVGKRCVAALLTGMGNDGAQGLKNIRDIGGLTIAQDEASSVVWGMPGSAVALGGASQVLPLDKVGRYIAQTMTKVNRDDNE